MVGPYYDALRAYGNKTNIKESLFENCLKFGMAFACKNANVHTNSPYTLEQLEALNKEFFMSIVDAGLLDEYDEWRKKRIENFFAEEEEEC